MSNAFIAVLTRKDKVEGKDLWKAPTWVQNEIGFAFSLSKPIVAFVEKGVEEKDGVMRWITDYIFFDRSNLDAARPQAEKYLQALVKQLTTCEKVQATDLLSKNSGMYLVEEQYRRDHQKRIVAEAMTAWKERLSNPYRSLRIETDNITGELKFDFSPFAERNPQISYFESHLETGYPSLWTRIRTWRDAYSKLVKRTIELSKRIRNFGASNFLPEYVLLKSSEEHINYNQFLIAYFNVVLCELQKLCEFEVQIQESIRDKEHWFGLRLAGFPYQFVYSPNKEKIIQLERRIKELHNDEQVFKEFKDIFDNGEELNVQLKGILGELEKIRAEVENDVPLNGWCAAGVKGKYERESELTPEVVQYRETTSSADTQSLIQPMSDEEKRLRQIFPQTFLMLDKITAIKDEMDFQTFLLKITSQINFERFKGANYLDKRAMTNVAFSILTGKKQFVEK